MKKGLKIAAFVAALVLIAGVGWFANALVGNPISKALATRAAQQRLETVYADKDYYIERVSYSFKDGNYHAFIKSDTSIDSSFSVTFDMLGRLGYDAYEHRVLSKVNTADRITTAYREMYDEVLQSPAFPFVCHIDYGDIEFTQTELLDNPNTLDYALMMEDLELDKLYDIRELGAKAGHLVIYIDDNEVSYERAGEILIAIRSVFDDSGVPFYAIDFVLTYPKTEEGGYSREDRVDLNSFLYSDIYEDGITNRVALCAEQTEAYYAAMDK